MIKKVPVAVVGVSALFPGSLDATGFWKDILGGVDRITDIPPNHWLIEDYYDPDPAKPDKTYARRGGFLSKVGFDPMEYGIPPNIVPATDTCQLLALIVAQMVLEDASRGQFANIDREKMSVVLGVTSAQELMLEMASRLQRPIWLKALRDSGIPEDEAQKVCERISASYTPWQEATFPGLLGNVVAGRIANRFDLRGTNAVTDAACASTLSALSMCLNELYTGQSDVAICGGADTMNDISMFICFSKTPALSPSGDCRPFSDAADGTMLGEGIGMVALKRLDDAEKHGDKIYAVIKSLGSSSDGRGPSVYAPLAAGQARALRRTYENAGYGPDTVEFVEAHGTGTKAGDAAEFEGLRTVFDESGRKDRQWCAVGSVKSQIGHTKSAAGAASLFKTVMALHHKVFPPTLKVDRPNPKLTIDKTPFYVNTEARPWIRGADHVRRASVSSFGFGGSNFHVTLEEHVGSRSATPRLHDWSADLIVASGADGAAVAAKCGKLIEQVRELGLYGAAKASHADFSAKHHARLAIVAGSAAEAIERLTAAAGKVAGGSAFTAPGIAFGIGGAGGSVAFLFPGQGSQYVGMGSAAAIHFDVARQVFDQHADVKFDGTAVHEVVFPRPMFNGVERDAALQKLTATEWAQPAIGLVSLSLCDLLAKVGVRPSQVAGHSFGEVVALHVAGVLSREDVVQVARQRGERMRDAAARPGAMLAVGRPIEDVNALMAKHGAKVSVANHNHPTQVVLSGDTAAIEAFEAKLVADNVTCKRLPVATAFHSPIVADSVAPFRKFLDGVAMKSPSMPVYANSEAAPYAGDAAAMRDVLAGQIAKPVRFVEQIEAMYALGARVFVEVGPNAVLTELVGRILGKRPHAAVALDRKGKDALPTLLDGLGKLLAAGVAVDLDALYADEAPPKPPKPKAKLELAIDGTNYAKPYPPKGGAAALPKPNPARQIPAQPAAVGGPPPKAAAVPPAPAAPVALQAPKKAPVRTEVHVSDSQRPLPSDAHSAWVRAYQDAQRQTADAHAAYQRAMADSHLAFLRTIETSFAGLQSMLTGQPVAVAAPVAYAQPLPAPTPAPAFAPAPTYAPAPVAAAPVARPAPAYQAPPAAVMAPPPAPAPISVAPPTKAALAAAVDVEALMLAVVSEKTGYPSEMLGMQMELEGDLGIDSIKRVEILSTVKERAPGLPEVDANEMGKLRTLGEIVNYLRSKSPAGSAPASKPAAPAPAAAPTTSAAPAVDVEALMLAVVSEKTGYPGEMLGMQMELEGDLGIDSIKRVEILSTVKERAPGLPEVDANEMSKLRTLGEIVNYLRKSSPAGAPAPAAAPAAATPAASAAPAVDVEALMLAVVSEKTGYPSEMLGMQMELEGDLGIDSIKRVEILSTVKERAPGLPEVDANEMSKLRTLGEIVNYLRKNSPAVGGAGAAAAAVAVAEPVHGIHRFVVEAADSAPIGLLPSILTAGGRIVVIDDGDLASRVARRLGTLGVNAEVGTSAEGADGVVFLGFARESTSEAGRRVCLDAFAVAKTVAARFESQGGLFVTVQDTGGDFGLSGRGDAWTAGLAGLVKTAALEWPKASCKAIDIDRDGLDADAIADRIADEIAHGGPLHEVGLGRSRRITLRTVDRAISGVDRSRIGPKSVIVVSGGGRGVTAASVIELARQCKPKIVVLGRTALADEPAACAGAKDDAALKRALLTDAKATGRKITPAEIGAEVGKIVANREIRSTLASIAAAGGSAKYVATDVQDSKKLSAALDAVRAEWGPITGIVHGAGVLADKKIVDKTPEQVERVFDTKVRGLVALLEATKADPIDTVALFSSVAARTGNLGQCDYAMANEVLNKVAWKLRAKGIHARSIGWGPWAGGMVTPALAAHFEKMGVALIPIDVGAKMLVDEMTGGSEVETVIGGSAGEGPLGAHGDPTADLSVRVHRSSNPELADHVIAGRPVVPVALAIEWICRAAAACRPDLHVAQVRDIKVLRGIKLDGYDAEGDALQLHARQLTNGRGATIGVEIGGAKGAKHYAATVEMVESRSAGTALQAPARLSDWAGPIYDGHALFHGPAFQAITAVRGVSEAGISLELGGLQSLGWPAAAWQTDPAATDAAIQAGVLWAKRVHGVATLPMGLGSYSVWHGGPIPAGSTCVAVPARTGSQNAEKSTVDVSVVGPDGTPLFELRGLLMVMRPGEKAAGASAAV